MSVWRPLFIKCIILDHKLQRMLNDSKIAQLDSERPLRQTAVLTLLMEGVHLDMKFVKNFTRPDFSGRQFYTLKRINCGYFQSQYNSVNA